MAHTDVSKLSMLPGSLVWQLIVLSDY